MGSGGVTRTSFTCAPAPPASQRSPAAAAAS